MTDTVGFLTNLCCFYSIWLFIYSTTAIKKHCGNKLTEILSLFAIVVSDVNVSSNWRGYLAIWFSESLTTDDGMPGLANCRALPKVRKFLYMKFTRLSCYLDFLVISNSNQLPVDVLFQSFTIGCLETPVTSNHFLVPISSKSSKYRDSIGNDFLLDMICTRNHEEENQRTTQAIVLRYR